MAGARDFVQNFEFLELSPESSTLQVGLDGPALQGKFKNRPA